jgi:pimeloyl-ACP methyl ester carboxylesterase
MIGMRTLKLQDTTMQYLCLDRSDPLVDELNKPLLIMLHGFPENSWTWEAYFEPLSDDFCVIAPDLPGYNGSLGFDSEQDYSIPHLVQVISEFIGEISQGDKVHLIAHDWGGVIAWPLAAFHAEQFVKLTILNAAHPTGFTREMANNPKQQANSDYITDLVSEDAFSLISAKQHAMLKGLYGRVFYSLSNTQQSAFERQWADRFSMEQSFAYYKNMPQLVTQRIRANSDVKLPKIDIKIPTQVLWGIKDTAFVPEVLIGMQEWVEDLSLIKFDDANHWLHHQEIAEVLKHIKHFHLA